MKTTLGEVAPLMGAPIRIILFTRSMRTQTVEPAVQLIDAQDVRPVLVASFWISGVIFTGSDPQHRYKPLRSAKAAHSFVQSTAFGPQIPTVASTSVNCHDEGS